MKVILDENLYDNIWNIMHKEFGFQPRNNEKWLDIPMPYKIYKLKAAWNERQESIVNHMLEQLCTDEIYALDWQHDCFEFNPNEKILLDYNYYDAERQCKVYFPSYYPNGDYHFFIAKDWSYGLLGHPWRKELYVFGEELIRLFEEAIVELELEV